jgi:hypothetical protein
MRIRGSVSERYEGGGVRRWTVGVLQRYGLGASECNVRIDILEAREYEGRKV